MSASRDSEKAAEADRIRFAPAALLAALGCAALAGCSEAPAQSKPEPPKVTVQHPEERELVDSEKFNGWTRASETVEVRARVRGHIHKVHFTDGQIVHKGDLLFELDPRPFRAEIDRAKEQHAVDQAQLEFATAEAERNETLYEKKTISKAEYEKAVAQKKSWVAKVAASEEEIKYRELDLEYSRIKAETTGRVGRAMLTAGNLVNAGGSDPLLTTVVKIDPMYVYFPVDERTLLRFRARKAIKEKAAAAAKDAASSSSTDEDEQETNAGAGDEESRSGKPSEAKADSAEKASQEPEPPATSKRANEVKDSKVTFEFGLETEKGYPRKGLIDFADNRIDPETGTIEVRGSVPNKENELIPGSRVRVQVPVTDKYRAIVVPDLAILSDQDQRYVLALNDENVVVRRNVSLGKLLDDGMRVVLPASDKDEKLTPKDRVIVQGLQRARLNDPVEPVDADGKPVGSAKK